MGTMKKRPALIAAAVIASGILTAKCISLRWEIFAAVALLFLFLSIFEIIKYSRAEGRFPLHSVFFLFALFFSSAASFTVNSQFQNNNHLTRFLHSSDSLTITCKVIDEPRVKDGKARLLVSILLLQNEFDLMEVEGKAYLSIFPNKRLKEKPAAIEYGSVLTFKSVLQEPSTERNPGEFSYKDYLALNNVYATVSVFGYSNVRISEKRETNWFFEQIIFPSKNFVVKTISTVMKGDEANFLIGLLLGDRTDISEEIKNAFTNTGTIHVLAVSGSHVILVVTIMYIIFGLLRFSKKPKIVLTIIALVYYTFLTGATPSVVRASSMAGIVLLGKFFEQKTDIYNVLGLSAVLMFIYDTNQLFDVGFQLSFSAVFSMVYFYPKLNLLIKKIPEPLEEFKIITPVWQLFAVSLAAQLGTIPFTAYYFGKISLVALFANLLVVPLVGLIVTIGLTGAMLGIISLWFASIFSQVNNLLAWFTLTFVKLAEQTPLAVVNTSAYGWKETALYSVMIAWLFNFGNAAVQKKIIFVSLIGCNIFLYAELFSHEQRNLRVAFLDVGQGDAAVVEFPNGETIVVDAGPRTSGFDAGERIVAPYLRRRGINNIDAIITTHPHADHLGGVPFLLKNFSVKKTIDANQRIHSELFNEYHVLEQRTEQATIRSGITHAVGNARLYFLHPTQQFIDEDSADGYSNINESSIVFKLHYGNTSFLFMGDAETESEEQIARVYRDFLHSDVIKAGHHGSSTSSTEELLLHATPRHVVISVAKFNKFKHPSKVVIERYQQCGAKVYRTDVEGAVIFESDGENVKKVFWRNE